MQTGLNSKKINNMHYLLIAVIAVFVFSFCVDGINCGFNTPAQVVAAIKTWIELGIAKLTDSPVWLRRSTIVGEMPFYGSVIVRIKLTVITFFCGMLLALSGSIFQTVFRNPMAAPTMLGVSSGVNLGVLLLIMQFGVNAYEMMLHKYIYCYAGAIAVLIIVLATGKISSGPGRLNVFDLIITGAIISQILGALMSYYTYAMDNDIMLVYQEIVGALRMDTSANAFKFLIVASIVGIVPMFMMRFSFNAVAFENDDTRSLGVNSYGMKIVTMILGTIMVTAAMVHCGSVGMISLIVPYISRAMFGAEFRRVFWGNLLIGGGILVLCKDIVGLIPFGTSGLPLGTIVDYVAMPVFVVMMVSKRRVWNEA